MIDLFRPFMCPQARTSVSDALIPDARTGRLYIGQGEQVERFEKALRTFTQARQDVLTLNSCTSALDLALHLCGVGGQVAQTRSNLGPQADIVISTPMTCTATNSPIVTRGGYIVWADVDPLTGLIDPQSVQENIDRLWAEHNLIPNAIMAVDWGGQLVDYPNLRKSSVSILDPERSIPIIQDAAHSFGTTVGGVPFLNTDQQHGDYTCFSFQAIKTLTTIDGGALVCPTPEETERARLLRWYGLDRRSKANYRCDQDIQEVGYKFHMHDIAAVIGQENLEHVDHNIDQHQANANYYAGVFHGLTGMIMPPAFQNGDVIDLDQAFWLFTLLVSDRDHFQQYMAEKGIETSPVHARNDQHTAFRDAEFGRYHRLPGVDFFAAHEIAIPVGWWLTADERDQVVDAVCTWSKLHGQELVTPNMHGVGG